jgi:hypothetical protein
MAGGAVDADCNLSDGDVTLLSVESVIAAGSMVDHMSYFDYDMDNSSPEYGQVCGADPKVLNLQLKVPGCSRPDTEAGCPSGQFCDGWSFSCKDKLSNGQPCSADAACSSGFCMAGVCLAQGSFDRSCCINVLPSIFPSGVFNQKGTGIDIFRNLQNLGCPVLSPADVTNFMQTGAGTAVSWLSSATPQSKAYMQACNRTLEPVKTNTQKHIIAAVAFPTSDSNGAASAIGMCTAIRPCDNRYLFGFSGDEGVSRCARAV